MFDIRSSQFRYIEKMNEMRERFWQVFDIRKEGLAPLGAGVSLCQVAKTDFGVHMAWTMSLIDGALVGTGSYILLDGSASAAWRLGISGLLFLLLGALNSCSTFASSYSSCRRMIEGHPV